MSITWDQIEDAFFFVSTNQGYEHNAYLCKDTGQIFYTSDMGDSDELPEDIDDPKYISIPHKNDLDLGRDLVIKFVSLCIPEDIDRVYSFFRHRGAYARYKEFLFEKDLLDKWYTFENERQEAALRKWCVENDIEIVG